MRTRQMNRRQFLGSAAAVATFTIVPRHVLGGARQVPPSEKLNIASIGVAGMGAADIQSVSTENIVALCDVDWRHAAKTFDKYPNAKKYRDFRKMFETEAKNIDAVTVSTPDHIHAVAAMVSVKMGKHVYCQKPLCHDVYEVRQLTEAARKQGVATQMGTQLHATGEMKTFVEWVKAGVIGKIATVLGRNDISIYGATASLMPVKKALGNVRVVTKKVRESQIQKALVEINRLSIMRGKAVVVRIVT